MASRDETFDWIGHWFTLVEKTGEHSNIVFGNAKDCEEPRLFVLPHAKYDGASGFIHLLRQTGQLHEDVLPKLPKRERPSLLIQIREALKIVVSCPLKPRKWIMKNDAWKRGISSNESTAYGWTTLNKEESAQAVANSKASGVSLNSWLLTCLAQSVEPNLEPGKRPSIWMVPVSIHENISVDLKPQNQSSYFDVDIRHPVEAAQVENEVRRKVSNHAHWGAWLLLSLGKYLGEWVMRLMVATNPKNVPKTGIFTNVGNWSGPSQKDGDGIWFVVPPVVDFQPFGAGALTWNSQIGLTVRLHPCLTADAAVANKILADWKTRLLTRS